MKRGFLLCLILCISLHAYEGEQSSMVRSAQIQQPKKLTYNSPARIDTDNSWDVAVSGSFIYWYAGQDMMDLAKDNPNLAVNITPIFPVINGGTVYFNFQYQPGFKVSIGSNLPRDSWMWMIEYTRLNFTEGTSVNSTGFLVDHWFVAGNNNFHVTSMTTEWHLNFNLFDLKLSRPFYSGKRLVISPYFGMRGGIINQSFRDVSVLAAIGIAPAPTHPVSTSRSDSWLIGPRSGMIAEWMLGYGLSFSGSAAIAVCYQDLKVHLNQDWIRFPGTIAVDNYTNKFSQLMANADFSLGLTWGSYFHNDRWHFLLAALYEFNVFWDQNVMRDQKDEFSNQDSGIGNLYLHGLTAKAQFDF